MTSSYKTGAVLDGAGDFDALLRRHRGDLPILGQADTYRDADFTSQQAAAMQAEIEFLIDRSSDRSSGGEVLPGAARRGLLRLREMARWCAAHEGSLIAWSGD